MSEKKGDMIWIFLLSVVLASILIAFVWGLGGGYMSGMMGMMGSDWGFMVLIPIAFLVLIVLGAYYLITEFMRTNRPAYRQNERSLDILRERYAKGEITREQYLKMKKELEL